MLTLFCYWLLMMITTKYGFIYDLFCWCSNWCWCKSNLNQIKFTKNQIKPFCEGSYKCFICDWLLTVLLGNNNCVYTCISTPFPIHITVIRMTFHDTNSYFLIRIETTTLIASIKGSASKSFLTVHTMEYNSHHESISGLETVQILMCGHGWYAVWAIHMIM